MSTLQQQVESVRNAHGVPALGALVLSSTRVLEVALAGRRRADDETPVREEDRFHIGSCTKAMTATLIARLVDAGKLRWNQTIGETFPALKPEIHEAYHAVTLEQLLLHRGGIAEDRNPDPLLMLRLRALEGDMRSQRRQALVAVLQREPAASPGSQMLYSNFGYMIAGTMAEQATGESWETLMRRWVFNPLKMRHVGFGAPGKPARKPDQPRGHLGQCRTPVEPGPLADNPPVLGPAGTIHCALRDWARFAQLHLQIAQGKRTALLKPETARKLHTDPHGQGYSMGWVVVSRPWAKGQVLMHAGSNTMWYALAVLAPALDRGWLIVTNCGSDAAQQACEQLLRELAHP
ncbi:MAG: beta-lactamase family protein [Armatimonadetes bacterium]|jgi:CubicO group peptidase (beta-lactamase class C family)|nr:beta-lactamase family protein [Armatimonadota bacterium]